MQDSCWPYLQPAADGVLAVLPGDVHRHARRLGNRQHIVCHAQHLLPAHTTEHEWLSRVAVPAAQPWNAAYSGCARAPSGTRLNGGVQHRRLVAVHKVTHAPAPLERRVLLHLCDQVCCTLDATVR